MTDRRYRRIALAPDPPVDSQIAQKTASAGHDLLATLAPQPKATP